MMLTRKPNVCKKGVQSRFHFSNFSGIGNYLSYSIRKWYYLCPKLKNRRPYWKSEIEKVRLRLRIFHENDSFEVFWHYFFLIEEKYKKRDKGWHLLATIKLPQLIPLCLFIGMGHLTLIPNSVVVLESPVKIVAN